MERGIWASGKEKGPLGSWWVPNRMGSQCLNQSPAK